MTPVTRRAYKSQRAIVITMINEKAIKTMTGALARPNKNNRDVIITQTAITLRHARANINDCVAADLRILSTDTTPLAEKPHALILELQRVGDTIAQLASTCESSTRDTTSASDRSRALQQARTLCERAMTQIDHVERQTKDYIRMYIPPPPPYCFLTNPLTQIQPSLTTLTYHLPNKHNVHSHTNSV